MSDDIKPADVFGREPASDMSLRDYFAGQALIGLMQSEIQTASIGDTAKASSLGLMEAFAHVAYAYADEMLKEREKQDMSHASSQVPDASGSYSGTGSAY